MDLPALERAEPTLDENASRLLAAWFRRQPWYYYHSEASVGINVIDLARRFLRIHARIPGLFTTDTLGLRPINVLQFRKADGSVAKGAQYSNGAVILLPTLDHTTVWLMVDEDTMTKWGYPETTLDYQTIGNLT